MKEKITGIATYSSIKIEENKIIEFKRTNSIMNSFRVLKDGFLGVHYQEGDIADDIGYARAEENLVLKRPYKFGHETGKRHRDKTEKELTDKELMELAKEALLYIHSKYPDFTFKGNVSRNATFMSMTNTSGLDYSNRDQTVNIDISFKHRDSKDITDGWFGIGMRDFDIQKFYDMADNYLSNFTNEVPLPDEIIVQMQYYSLLGKLHESLDAEKMCLGTSLLSGKIGEKVFAENFNLVHDVSDKECWHTMFFDGEGVTVENDIMPFIENGVLLRGYSDKKVADKYGVEHTGSANATLSDIPSNGNVNLRITRSDKTIRELLNGRMTVIPVRYSGGGFNDKGEYTMPVQMAYLCDGDKIIGRLPEFTLVSSMPDMFGDDFIGVGSDDPIFNDKQILVRMKLGKT